MQVQVPIPNLLEILEDFFGEWTGYLTLIIINMYFIFSHQ